MSCLFSLIERGEVLSSREGLRTGLCRGDEVLDVEPRVGDGCDVCECKDDGVSVCFSFGSSLVVLAGMVRGILWEEELVTVLLVVYELSYSGK